MHDLIGLGRGSDKCAVSTDSTGRCPDRSDGIGAVANIDDVCTEGLGQGQPVRIEVDPNDVAAACSKQLHTEETDQAEAKDDKRLSKHRLTEPKPLQRDRPQHGECRFFVTNAIGNLGAQVLGNAHHFRMASIADNAVARSNADAGVMRRAG